MTSATTVARTIKATPAIASARTGVSRASSRLKRILERSLNAPANKRPPAAPASIHPHHRRSVGGNARYPVTEWDNIQLTTKSTAPAAPAPIRREAHSLSHKGAAAQKSAPLNESGTNTSFLGCSHPAPRPARLAFLRNSLTVSA